MYYKIELYPCFTNQYNPNKLKNKTKHSYVNAN